jgi:hypothetical protein
MSQLSQESAVTGSAAAASDRRVGGALLVLVAGVVTTVLALLGVWWLDNNTKDFHIMGWYGDYVIPAGAMIVGFAAGSGYGIASYLTGLRIRRGLLLAVLALQLGGYAGAQYMEFRSLTREGPLVDETGETLSFARFYHIRATSFAWDNHGHPGEPLGGWGYFFLGLGVVGFALGGVFAPAILMKMPYCEGCSLYMKSRSLAWVPASVRARRVSKKDVAAQAAYAEEQERAAAGASGVLTRVSELAARGDGLAIRAVLADHPSGGGEVRRINRLPARLRVRLVRCRQCGGGHIQPAMVTGQGRGIRVKALDRLPLPPDATRLLAGE